MAFGYPPNSDCIYYTTVLCKIQPFFFAGELFPRGDHPLALPYFFIIKVRRRLRAQPQPSAQYYISMGCGDDIPAGVQGRRPCPGQGVEPLGYSRTFSDMCGESAPAMTQRGEHACVRSARNEVRPKWRHQSPFCVWSGRRLAAPHNCAIIAVCNRYSPPCGGRSKTTR